jgi:hypothetical protein
MSNQRVEQHRQTELDRVLKMSLIHSLPPRLRHGLQDESVENLQLCVQITKELAGIQRGQVPAHWTGWVVCTHCGPVFAPETDQEGVSVVGCPWCHVTNPTIPIPRPKVRHKNQANHR